MTQAEKRYHKAYIKYAELDFNIPIRAFCRNERLYYEGFKEWLEKSDFRECSAADFGQLTAITIVY